MPHDQLSNDLASLRIDRSEAARPPNRLPRVLVYVGILAGLAALALFVGYPMLQSRLFKPEVNVGAIVLLSPAQSQVQLTGTGYVVAETTANVAAKVVGRVAEIFVTEGQTVEKGAVLARLEDVDQKSAVASARARAAASRARIQTARATLAETKQTLAREQQLFERGVSGKAAVEDLERRVDSLAAAVRAAEADAQAADAEARALEVQLGSYLVTAPIPGTIVDKLVEVGEVVSPGIGAPGVVQLVDFDSLVVEVDVPEPRLGQIKVGAPTEIMLDAYSTERYRGSVKEIGHRVNRAKATVPVKVAFVDRPKEVLPDMAARVSFLTEALDEKTLKEPPKLVAPAAAIVQRNGIDVVFVIDDGKVRMAQVAAGAPFQGGRELSSGPPAGTKVVLDPQPSLQDGQTVKERNP